MKCYIFGGIELKVPYSFIVLILVSVAMRSSSVLWSFFALVPHELGHLLGAAIAHQKISSIELMPFGAAMHTASRIQSPKDELFIAACGPAASVFAATIVAGIISFFEKASFLSPLIGASLLLCFVNLVPALPLDGGRMLRAFLSKTIRASLANKICAGVGIFLSVFLAAYGVFAVSKGVFNPSAFMLSVFIFVGALSELRQNVFNSVAATYTRAGALQQKGSLTLRTIAMNKDKTASQALRSIKGATLIAVVDDSMHLVGTLAEGDLLNAIIQSKDDNICLGKILANSLI